MGSGMGASFPGCTGYMLLHVAFVDFGLGLGLGLRAGLHLLVKLLEAVYEPVDEIAGHIGGDGPAWPPRLLQ